MSNMGHRRGHAREDATGAYVEHRTELLHAAAAAFRSKGFQGVRVGDVAQQIGVDRATLYYYFGNKQELFLAVILEAVEDNVSRAKAIASGGGSASERL